MFWHVLAPVMQSWSHISSITWGFVLLVWIRSSNFSNNAKGLDRFTRAWASSTNESITLETHCRDDSGFPVMCFSHTHTDGMSQMLAFIGYSVFYHHDRFICNKKSLIATVAQSDLQAEKPLLVRHRVRLSKWRQTESVLMRNLSLDFTSSAVTSSSNSTVVSLPIWNKLPPAACWRPHRQMYASLWPRNPAQLNSQVYSFQNMPQTLHLHIERRAPQPVLINVCTLNVRSETRLFQ